jgi:hypothetical protein
LPQHRVHKDRASKEEKQPPFRAASMLAAISKHSAIKMNIAAQRQRLNPPETAVQERRFGKQAVHQP